MHLDPTLLKEMECVLCAWQEKHALTRLKQKKLASLVLIQLLMLRTPLAVTYVTKDHPAQLHHPIPLKPHVKLDFIQTMGLLNAWHVPLESHALWIN